MTGFLITAAVLLFFTFLLTVPLHIVVCADDDIRVWFRVLFIRIGLFPPRKRRKKRKKKKDKSAKKAKKSKKNKPEPKKKSGILSMIRLISHIAAAVIRKLSRHLRIRICRYELVVSTDDAAKTAVLYGTAAGLSSNLFTMLSEVANFRVKKNAAVDVRADFVAEKSRLAAKIDFYTNLWGVLALLLAAGLAFVRHKNIQKEQ